MRLRFNRPSPKFPRLAFYASQNRILSCAHRVDRAAESASDLVAREAPTPRNVAWTERLNVYLSHLTRRRNKNSVEQRRQHNLLPSLGTLRYFTAASLLT